MRFEFIDSIDGINADTWDALWQACTPTNYPFVQHAFLSALENSGSTTGKTGWQAQHLLGWQGTQLRMAMPLFLKTHSYGEYVFDWSWADAYQQYGLNYYPKLVNAIPFTPSTGPRIAICPSFNTGEKNGHLVSLHKYLMDFASTREVSSIHCLFPNDCSAWEGSLYTLRTGTQFHWFNNDYTSFDHFLECLSSRKRKNIRKERNKSNAFTITFKEAKDVDSKSWDIFYQLYQRTYFKRSGRAGYLGESFFKNLAHSMPHQLLLAEAKDNNKTVAAAVYFKDQDCLYGRYWGAIEEYDGLHFETCYYCGIEYAIKHKLKRFDPGAQGEHKIQRGFQSVETRSFHWIKQNEFREAINKFCQQEAHHNKEYLNDTRNYLPFKENINQVAPNILFASTSTKNPKK